MIRKVLSAFLAVAFCATAQNANLTAREAKDHVGEVRTVCGKVASTHYATGSKGQPTFLDLDEPYPKEIFTILIWGSDRAKFGTPQWKYRNSQVCVNGKIELYRGIPEIIATEPSQLICKNNCGGNKSAKDHGKIQIYCCFRRTSAGACDFWSLGGIANAQSSKRLAARISLGSSTKCAHWFRTEGDMARMPDGRAA
jgi:hypothetical protein